MIPSDLIIKIAIGMLGAAAGAGAALFSLRQTRMDLKGVTKRHMKLVACLVRWADTEEKRNQIADVIEPK